MPATQTHPVDPALAQFYDLLMQSIEPELTSEMLPTLAWKYPPGSETEEEAAAREERYRKAFALCDERCKFVMGKWKEDIQAEKKRVLGVQLTRSIAEDNTTMSRLDDAIGNA